MKILVVSQYFWPEVFRINDICDGLTQRGHSVDVLTSLPNVPQGKFYEGYGWFRRGPKTHNGVNIERVGVVERSKSNKVMWALNCASFAINSLFHIPKLARRDYDAIFVFNNSPVTVIFPAMVMRWVKKIPNLVFVLDIWPESLYSLLDAPRINKNTLFYKISFAVSRWLYKSADTLLISSKGFEQKLKDMGLTAPMPYFPNYAEPVVREEGFSVSREQFGFADDDFVVGFAGGMGVAQGIDLIVQAANRIREEQHIKYLFMGDGTEFLKIKKLVEDLDLQDRFVFTGWVAMPQLPAHMQLCDVMMMALKDNEVLNITVPAKLQTYMHERKPVLAFMNGAGAEAVTESGCGVAVEAENIEQLADTILSLSKTEKAALAQMGENGHHYCSTAFEREQVLDLLEQELQKAIAQQKGNKQK
ncbi:MAG: glycosyltransferase family 4 protein [Oscillospiraceae bacterium]|nr:glycosyltransferase family 4 protein [Oscillospiraceae bacterium]